MTLFRTFVCVAFLAMVVGCAGLEVGEEGEPITEAEPAAEGAAADPTATPRVDLDEVRESMAEEGDRFTIVGQKDDGEPGTAEMRWECGGDPWVCCRGCGGWPDTCQCCVWNGDSYDC
jgi:hypothetical protein